MAHTSVFLVKYHFQLGHLKHLLQNKIKTEFHLS